ncbi:MAG: BlaI/MecI/CopY family transcriptional regulator [Lachnospiraceae bacterium]|nr:BlaI/MecI/CopY family transcriptional regulator [Lachnospiraceae bacterium]
MGETTPSENEWLIMEVIWKENRPITASEIIEKLKGVLDISQKTIRVMIGRLVSKGVLDYTIDKNDARIYHYFPQKTKDECLNMKSRRFVKNYFGGDASLAVASFLKSGNITEEQLAELERLVESLKEGQ